MVKKMKIQLKYNSVEELQHIINNLNVENEYQKLSLKIIKMNLRDLTWANRENLIDDIIFRLKDAFGIELIPHKA